MVTTLPEGFTLLESDPEFGGLSSLRVHTQAADLVVLPHGAHVCHWQPAGERPVLWMSAHSHFSAGQPVRGGVPICFPWFGPGRSGDQVPAHGWARIVGWRLVLAKVDEGDAVVEFVLEPEAVAGQPGAAEMGDFEARYRVQAGRTLTLSLTVTAGEVPLDVEQALHTYLAVDDLHEASVSGLDGDAHLDKVTGQHETQSGDVEFTAETDRVYDSAGPVVLNAGARTVEVTTEGAAQTVVWNPWIAKAAAMPDYGDDEWPGMVCIEAANVLDRPIRLEPGQSHTTRARYRLA
ncbi:D-hexose-6-phosphate mutarotase [Aestuariimicrobium ganziense]|uniref:D-hexose-6-phosphate mutarotase n=1 Tax=Aestuariimicrobium ganziense TaxID=2773677 RepID=UPI0019406444|nr:D-hexose-6-phosphate mutarotase [Aestuariimicrobium ganziense]